MLKGLLILACVDHVLCGYSDCLLSYGKNGRLNLTKRLYASMKRMVFSLQEKRNWKKEPQNTLYS